MCGVGEGAENSTIFTYRPFTFEDLLNQEIWHGLCF